MRSRSRSATGRERRTSYRRRSRAPCGSAARCRRWSGRWGWVYVVALNAERTRWRREEQRADRRRAASDPVIPDVADATLDSVVLRDALARLTARQRAAVVLRYLADLSTADVAAALGCAEGTVKATVSRALRRLRIDLAHDVDLEVAE